MTEPSPILPYATPGDAGVPDWYAPVEEMLDRRCRPKEIRVHFRQASHAAEYFARAMTRRFAVETVGHRCDACGQVCDGFASVGWSVEMPRKHRELALGGSPQATFGTFHAFCGPCHTRLRRRLRCVNLVRLIVCLAMGVGLIWMFIVRHWGHGRSLMPVLMPGVLLFTGAVSLVLANGWARLVVPRPIRKRLPPGISVCSVGDRSTRGALAPSPVLGGGGMAKAEG